MSKQYTILVVDDQKGVLIGYRKTLEKEGYRVVEAEDGEEALALFSECQPDIVLMDYLMPGLDEIAVCRQLQTLPGGLQVPVVMITVINDVTLIKDAFIAGAIDFVVKPVEWVVLKQRIKVLLAARESALELRRREEHYRLITENVIDVISIYNVGRNRFTFVSPSVKELFGYSVEEMLQFSIENILTPESNKLAFIRMSQELAKFRDNPQAPIRYVREYIVVRKDGTNVWVELSFSYRYNSSQEIEAVAVVRNIDERKKREAEFLFLSLHDPLTGLLNRHALRNVCASEDQGDIPQENRSVIIIDLDCFRVVNDTLGSKAGDKVLKDVADKIFDAVGSSGSLYRYAGNTFIAVIDSNDAEIVGHITSTIQAVSSNQFYGHNRQVFLTTSIGACLGSQHESVDQLVQHAETALYLAKKQKNTVLVYNASMEKIRTREVLLETDMVRALQKGEFELYYQPIVDIRHGIVNQAEALLRWNHPEYGRVSPVEFIPIAEKTNLIIPMTDWVIRHVCTKLAEWKHVGIDNLTVSINLSILCLQNRGDELMKTIADAINQSRVHPSNLKLEFTESVLMDNSEETVHVLWNLKKLGVKSALDDFGTGYSGFGYLKDLPLDVIKLDRSLIRTIDSDEREQMIVRSLITIFHGLFLDVVAEGVETKEQLEILKTYGCDYIQGYWFSHPLPEREFIEYCLAHRMSDEIAYLPKVMLRLEWRKEWECGNATIDNQHRELIRTTNELLTHVSEGKAVGQDTLTMLDCLLSDCGAHFGDEVQVLSEIGYPDWLIHSHLHESVLAKTVKMREAYRTGDLKFSTFVLFIVDELILGHLLNEDAKFFSYIRKTRCDV